MRPAHHSPEDYASGRLKCRICGHRKPIEEFGHATWGKARSERRANFCRKCQNKKRRGGRPHRPGHLYLLSEGEGSPCVKVGWSTNPVDRLKSMQTGNPRILKIEKDMRGTLEDEMALHKKYEKDCIGGEWFIATPGLLAEFKLDFAEWQKGRIEV